MYIKEPRGRVAESDKAVQEKRSDPAEDQSAGPGSDQGEGKSLEGEPFPRVLTVARQMTCAKPILALCWPAMDAHELDKAADCARDAVKSVIEDSGAIRAKRKRARGAVPYARETAVEQLDTHLSVLTDRAKRHVNGNLFTLEPDAPAQADDLVGEFVSDHTKRKPVAPVQSREVWARAFMEEKLTLEDLLPYRIRAAWRIVREMGRLKGLVADDEGLDCILGISPDPWAEPCGFGTDDTEMYSRLNGDVARSLVMLPLLPPAMDDTPCEGYNPRTDDRLHQYMATIHFISLYLHIERGSRLDPAQGRYGLYGIEDPSLIRLSFPSRLQILAWEDMIVEEAFRCMAEDGQAAAEEFLHDTYGLRSFETLSLIKLAKCKARKRLENDLEEDRAIMIYRLDEVARRAKTGMDLRTELGALKQMALVMGLGRSDPEDSLRDMIDVVARVASESRKPAVFDVPAEPRGLIEGVTVE